MSRGVVRLAYVLLFVMSIASFGGPFLIGRTVGGGESPNWPPDRPIEWAVFAGVTGVVVAILIGLGMIWLMSHAGIRRDRDAREADRGEP